MGWKQGESGNPAGRPKGSKDKYTHMKAGFIEAFEKLGGVDGMVKWVEEEPDTRRKHFYDWIVRLMPRDVSIETDDLRRSASEYGTGELVELLKGDDAA